MVKLFLIGVTCVGATSIGREISQRLGCNFYNLSLVIEANEGKTMLRIRREFLCPHSIRVHFRPILESFIKEHADEDYVMSLNPSCLMDHLWWALKAEEGRTVVAIKDRPENILKRVRFYDDDQRPLAIKLTSSRKFKVLKALRDDISYFRRSHKRADYQVDIDGRDVQAAADMILEMLKIAVKMISLTTFGRVDDSSYNFFW